MTTRTPLPAEDSEAANLQSQEPPPLVRLPEPKVARGAGIAAVAVSQSSQQAPPLNSKGAFPAAVKAEMTKPTPEIEPQAPSKEALETLRTEIMGEIEQVKNDLFGAVMGVSALKDRLDGLEQQVAALPPPPVVDVPSRQEVEQWSATWLGGELEPALERALVPLLEKIAQKSGLRLPFTPADAATALSQPPVILTCTPV
ncbi:MAG: hypothetical protein LDL31_10540 [Prosthecobacter sp.]|nr:hypothetical protein [Prosthecobacter sp.]